MQRLTLLVLVSVFLVPVSAIALDLPVDIYGLKYEDYARGSLPRLAGDNLEFTETLGYYGKTIPYTVVFDRGTRGNGFLFFAKPATEQGAFYALFEDLVMVLARSAGAIETSLTVHTTNESELALTFYFPADKPISVLQRFSPDTGFRGFAVMPVAGKKPFFATEEALRQTVRDSAVRIEDIGEFAPNSIVPNTLYIRGDFAVLPFESSDEVRTTSDGAFQDSFAIFRRSLDNPRISVTVTPADAIVGITLVAPWGVLGGSAGATLNIDRFYIPTPVHLTVYGIAAASRKSVTVNIKVTAR